MKKVLFLILLSLFLLTGCQNKDVGIIGGADGPTHIYVSNEEGLESMVCAAKLINIDGDLYYSVGEISAEVPRCGTLDGNLTQSVEGSLVPTESGTSNFPAEGYQNASEDTKEIPMGGEWEIFRKVTTVDAIGRYAHCLYMKGRTPNAVADSEYLVFTNDTSLTFEAVSRSLFSSHMNDRLDIGLIVINPRYDWGLTLTAENVTPSGLTIRCIQKGGNVTGELQTGDSYKIEMFDGTSWVEMPTILSNYAWNAMAYLIPKEDSTTFDINWEWLYGKLSAGTYRIGKRFDDWRVAGKFDSQILYTYFEISE